MNILKKVIILLFFIMTFFSFLTAVSDPDTPWHLATGQYILAHHEIPKTDPFTFANQKVTFFGKYILTQSWLAQIVMATVLDKAGVFGLALLKAFTFTVIIYLAWIAAREEGFYLVLVLLWLVILGTIKPYISVRPQMFTFLFTAALFFLLERWRHTRQTKYLIIIPLLLLLWTNMHGGVIFGVSVLFIYLVVVLSRQAAYSYGKAPEEKNYKALLAVCFAALVTYLLNPNGYGAFRYAFDTHATNYYSDLLEYKTPLFFMKNDTSPVLGFTSFWVGGDVYYWGLVAVSVLMEAYFIKRKQWLPAAILMFSCILGLSTTRYIPLFGVSFALILGNLPFKKWEEHLSEQAKLMLNVFFIIALGVMTVMSNPFGSPGIYRFQESRNYPVRAGVFLKENNISGNILVSYNKSGYILLSQYPASKIYSDARFIDPVRAKKNFIISGDIATRREYMEALSRNIKSVKAPLVQVWKDSKLGKIGTPGQSESLYLENKADILDEIHADIVVHGAMNIYSGLIYPLVLDLVRDNRWHLIYSDGNALIFVRDKEKFRKVIKKFEEPKEEVYDEIISEGMTGVRTGSVEFMNSVAAAMLMKGDAVEKAGKLIKSALNIEPKNKNSLYLMKLYKFVSTKDHGAP